MIKPILKALSGLSHDEFYKKHLEILNPILNVQLTKKEIEVLAGFMALQGDITSDRFGTQARKIIMKKLNQSSGGLGNHLKELRDKGFIYFDADGKYEINKFVIPPYENVVGYQFKIQKNG